MAGPNWRHRRRILGDVLLVVVVVGVDLLVWRGDRQLVHGEQLPAWAVPAASAAMGALLLARWRHPVAVWAAQWVYALSNLVLPNYYPFAMLLVALHAVAARCIPRAARLVLLTAVVPFGLFSYRSGQSGPGEGDGPFLEAAAVWTVVLAVVWGLGRVSYAGEQRARDKQRRLEREAELAVEAERQRLARELHDSVAGAVTAMIMHAAGARAHLPTVDGPAQGALRIVEQAGAQAMNELHRLLGLLRTPEGETAAEPAPSLAELDGLVDGFRRGGLDVAVEAVGERRPLDPSVDLAAYRVVQESLTNVVKHAGVDAAALVSLRWGTVDLRLEVRSTAGTAPPATSVPSSGLGLLGLRERVHLIGGRLESGATPDGWSVRAELPLTDHLPEVATTRAAEIRGTRR